MKFKDRTDVINTILKEALKNRDRAFGREINELERDYRRLTGYSHMSSAVYLAARVSGEYFVTNLYGLLGLDKEIDPLVKRIVYRAATLYFGRPVSINENIVYRSSSQQLESDRGDLRKKVAKLARNQIKSLQTKLSQMEKLMKIDS